MRIATILKCKTISTNKYSIANKIWFDEKEYTILQYVDHGVVPHCSLLDLILKTRIQQYKNVVSISHKEQSYPFLKTKKLPSVYV